MTYTIIHEDNLVALSKFDSSKFHLVYIDPPFGTNKTQKSHKGSYDDSHGDIIEYLRPRLLEILRVLRDDGSFFLHMDPREVHYAKVLLDSIFGRPNFKNEIIWSYDFGGRSKSRWSSKHDNILWYVKNPKNYTFNFSDMDRIPYMAPGLCGPEKAARGKTPTSVWWSTIVPTNGKERTGYPTQKPLKILERIVKIHSNPGDELLDCFAGSGSFGEAALKHGRNATLVDSNQDAISVMESRLSIYLEKTKEEKPKKKND
jgi:site-specific DNA-methyltransferase (adenine-specific)